MINLIRQYQTVLIFIVVVIGAYVGYQSFFAPSNEVVVTSTLEGGAQSDQDLVRLLFNLKAIRLDDAIFVDPLFTSLIDYGKELVPEPVGRQNPFAPLGGTPLPPPPSSAPKR